MPRVRSGTLAGARRRGRIAQGTRWASLVRLGASTCFLPKPSDGNSPHPLRVASQDTLLVPHLPRTQAAARKGPHTCKLPYPWDLVSCFFKRPH